MSTHAHAHALEVTWKLSDPLCEGNVLGETGVIVRQFDNLDNKEKPWLHCPNDGKNDW